MSYRVFARKYRPQTFEEVIGQEHITKTLRNAIRLKRLAQAYLFVGPRGIGKTSTARILAKALNCKEGPTMDPCGACDSCVEIAESRSLDVLEIDGASNNGVENVRELRESVSFSPARGPFKVYIIDEVHMLSSGAFNALLKTLEEPPPHVKFIFATTEAQKVPATITSRCQRFDLRRIPARLIASHLQTIASKEKIAVAQEASMAIAIAADGGLRDAESMLDQAVAFCGNRIAESDILTLFGLTPRQTVADLSSLVLGGKTAKALELVTTQAVDGRNLGRLLEDWIVWLRDVLVQQAAPDNSTDPAIQEQATLVPRGKLLELLDLLAEAQSRMKWTTDSQLQMDVAVIKAIHLLEQANLDDVLATLSALGSGDPSPFSASPSTHSTLAPKKTSPAPLSSPLTFPPAEASLFVSEKTPLPESPYEATAQAIWEAVTAETIQEGPIKFGWLSEGQTATLEGASLRVCFPKTSKTQFDSIFWGDIQAMLEKRLSQKRGTPTRLTIEFVDAPVREEPPPLSQETQSLSASPPPGETPIPSMENFKNDPLIRKALEIFKGTIQTALS